MPTFQDSVTRIRRFLRDPDGTIHSDAQLRRHWDAAGLELAQQSGFLERCDTYRFPARFHWLYVYDWEQGHTDGDTYQWALQWEHGGAVVTYPWEPAYWTTSESPGDDGSRHTQPWEGLYCTPADVIPVLIHAQHHRSRFTAYDREPISASTQREVATQDGGYRTRTGEAQVYYPLDESERLVCLYPRPPIVLDDPLISDTLDDTAGIVTWLDEHKEDSDYGLVIDAVDADDTLLMVYEALPTPAYDDDTESGWPVWAVHYVECGVLERALGADTDGYHPSLRTYWQKRKELGIEALRRFRTLRLRDQSFSMGGSRSRVRHRGPRLPDHYPEPG